MIVSPRPITRPAHLDSGVLFEREPGRPIPIDEVAVSSYRADPSHSVDQVVTAPDGHTFTTVSTFDWQRDRDKTSGGYALCVDPEGQQKWRFDAPAGFSVRSLAASSRGATYLLLEAESRYRVPQLLALDEHGQQVWTHQPDDYPHPRLDSVRRVGDQVILKAEKQVTALAADSGQQLWKTKLSIYPSDHFHVSLPDGRQVFANQNFSGNFGSDYFEAVELDGQRQRIKLPNFNSFPLRIDDTLIYAGDEGRMIGLNLDSLEHWELPTNSPRGTMTPWKGEDGRIYAKDRYEHRYYCFTPEGEMVWEQELEMAPGDLLDPPFKVAPDGHLFYRPSDRDGIASLRPDGSPGTFYDVSSVDEFCPDEGGNLYVLDYEHRVLVIPPGDTARYAIPLDFGERRHWKLTRVRQGVMELRDNHGSLSLAVTRDTVTERLKERYGQLPPAPPPPTIEDDGEWLVIGDVSLPIQ